MKRMISRVTSSGCVIAALLWSLSASATPLHGFCGGGSSTCSDNGTVTPITSNPPQFGFTISSSKKNNKPKTGTFYVDILVPNNYALPASFSITGTQGGTANTTDISVTASLFSGKEGNVWTSGKLAKFLGIKGSPANPLDAWLGYTQTNGDATATGYYVFQANLGTTRLQPNAEAPSGPLLTLGSTLGIGSIITGFLDTGTRRFSATAPSGGLFIAGPSISVPEPGTLALLAASLIGFAFLLRRRRMRY